MLPMLSKEQVGNLLLLLLLLTHSTTDGLQHLFAVTSPKVCSHLLQIKGAFPLWMGKRCTLTFAYMPSKVEMYPWSQKVGMYLRSSKGWTTLLASKSWAAPLDLQTWFRIKCLHLQRHRLFPMSLPRE